jgi:hypothetical protein
MKRSYDRNLMAKDVLLFMERYSPVKKVLPGIAMEMECRIEMLS